jgi:uncharacterized protein YaiL (DUF2058 family)
MNDLRHALKKAGLIDPKAERRLVHDENVRRKKLGREGLDQEKKKKQQARQENEQRQRDAVRQAQERYSDERQRQSRLKELLAQVEQQALGARSGGPKRFHYRDSRGFLPYLAVSDEVVRRLEAGELAIVRRPGRSLPVLVPSTLAAELNVLAADRVLFLPS